MRIHKGTQGKRQPTSDAFQEKKKGEIKTNCGGKKGELSQEKKPPQEFSEEGQSYKKNNCKP